MFRYLPHIILYCLFIPYGFAQQSIPAFHQITIEDGLPDSDITHILQDSKGFIWFSTPAGISRYDGYMWKNYAGSAGVISSMFEDSRGRMWIPTNGSLSVLEGNEISVLDTLPQIWDYRVFSILEDSSKSLWLSGLQGVFKIMPNGNIEAFNDPDQEKDEQLSIQFVDQQGQVWLYGKSNEKQQRYIFYQKEGDDLVRNKIELAFPFNGFTTNFRTLQLKDGRKLFTADKGLVFLDDKRQYIGFSSGQANWDFSIISSMIQDHNGDIWVSNPQSGVLKFSIEGERLVLTDHLLNDEKVTHMLMDKEYNLWFATEESGAFFLSAHSARTRNFNKKSGLCDDEIIFLYNDNEQDIWVAGGNRKVCKLKNTGVNENFEPLDIIENVLVRKALPLQEGGILVASNNDFYLLENGDRKFILGLGQVNSLHQSKDGFIYIATSKGAYKCTKKDLLNLVRDKIHVPFVYNIAAHFSGATFDFFEDHQKNLLLATSKGLHILDGTVESGELDRRKPEYLVGVSGIAQSADSITWIVTNGWGVIARKGKKDLRITTKNFLPSDVCNTLYVDDLQQVWIATNKGVSKISGLDMVNDTFAITNYDIRDGLLSNEVSSILKFKGDMYIGTKKGLAIFSESEELASSDYTPKVYITNVKIKGKDTTDFSQNFKLSHTDNTLEFFFTIISYQNLGKIKYRYKLIGNHDENWVETIYNHTKYQSLAPGDYRFVVEPSPSGRGKEHSFAEFAFTIKKPFWQRWYFFAGIAALLVLATYFLIWTRNNKRDREELKVKVKEATTELNRKVDELERTNKELKQFAYAASHDLKTPLRTIISHLQLIERRFVSDLNPEAHEYIAFAVNGAKKMYGMINDLLSYTKVGTQVDFNEVNLNSLLREIENSLKSLLDETNSKVIYNDLPTLTAVSTQLSLLFQNLIENGIKFNHSEVPEIRITCKDTPDYWQIYVSDNGIGIDEAYQHKVFKLFQRLHSTEFQGTGIGLAISKKVVEYHGGKIWIENKEGPGTTFCFTLAKNL